ncbi:MAG: MFS transporter [Firmicutes bacterium]|nr:MFS transporter [Bacillota bacterium]
MSASTATQTGTIAARIDRLPLTWVQYSLALITQACYGMIIGTDAVVARLYPFVWEPAGVITAGQFSILLAANTGLGILIGEYLLGFFSDRFGRKPTLILSAILTGIFLWPIALTTNFSLLLLFNILYAIGMGGVLSANSTYMHEISPPRERGKVSQRTQTLAAFLLGAVGTVPAIFWVPDHYQWYVFLLAALPVVTLIPLVAFWLPESPRWLEAKGRLSEADAVVSKWEERIRQRGFELPQPESERHTVITSEKVPVKEIFTGKYGRRTVILLICWIFGYAGIVYGTAGFVPSYLAARGFDPQTTFIVQFIGSVFGGALGMFVSSLFGERIERRALVMGAGILFALMTLALYVVPGTIGVSVLVILSNAPVILWLFNMYNYTANAYPTRLRSVGTGWTDGIGHLGSIAGPLIAGYFFATTASAGHIGWLLWIALPGALLPGLLLGFAGIRQRNAILEEIST